MKKLSRDDIRQYISEVHRNGIYPHMDVMQDYFGINRKLRADEERYRSEIMDELGIVARPPIRPSFYDGSTNPRDIAAARM